LRADALSSFRWDGPDQIERAQRFQRASGGTNGAVGEVKIASRRLQVFVPQQGLNHEEVHSIVQQMCGKRVAQRMRMNGLTDAGLKRRFLAGSENAIGCDGAIRVSPWEEPVGGPLTAP